MSEHLPSWYYEQALDYIDSLWNAQLTDEELHAVTRRQREAEYRLMAARNAGTRVAAPSDPKKEKGIKVERTESKQSVTPMIPSLPPGIRDMRCAYYPISQHGLKKTDQKLFARKASSQSSPQPQFYSFSTDTLPPAT